ncbi:MAG TPA: hypothetical protein VFC63_01240 [Blastocatellia bacterium]|nr:hypothetical protein [Blastocatellia bacterium]
MRFREQNERGYSTRRWKLMENNIAYRLQVKLRNDALEQTSKRNDVAKRITVAFGGIN